MLNAYPSEAEQRRVKVKDKDLNIEPIGQFTSHPSGSHDTYIDVLLK